MIQRGDSGWDRLYRVWVGEAKPEYLVYGGKTYRVYVDDKKVWFDPIKDDKELYADVSFRR